MAVKLIDIPAGELLKKFGAGSHKPGSGSASAHLGMMAAQLLLTVIDLTGDARRKGKYVQHLTQLLSIKENIELQIYPELEDLFQKDSEEFDKVIKLRRQRDRESDFIKKRDLSHQGYLALQIATEIPLKIAELSLQIGDHAAFVFDNGFKSARGDSNVALNHAISAVASALSIVELNLSILPILDGDWMQKIKIRKAVIKSRFEVLSLKGPERLTVLEKESEDNEGFYQSIAEFKKGNLGNDIKTDKELEELVRRLQNTLWLQREKIWKGDNVPKFGVEVLKPERVFRKVLDYVYEERESLGEFEVQGERFEIAGLIDKNLRVVNISKDFKEENRRFTAAHELGHALLHERVVQHRDRPVDGSSNFARNNEEIQADKFAAYFLMPSRSVLEAFEAIFETQKFVINEGSALALRAVSAYELKRKCGDQRGLAKLLASAEYYGGKTVNSLAKIFGVSIEAMAIRLEELDLLSYQ